MKLVLTVLACLLLAGVSLAAKEIRPEPVQFKPGEIGTTVKGRIKGEQIVDYILRAKARQTLVVILEGSNRSCYFNVTAPGEDSAMFVGSTSGSRFVGEAPKDGEYIVRLYLMRNAARRGETAAYAIHFAVADGGQGSKAAVPGGTPPTRYDASGKVKCSADKPTLDQWCDFRVVRDLPRKAADIWIANIAFKGEERYRFFHYENKVFATDDKAKLDWQRQDDNWWISVDGKEFYMIPDALIHGG